MPLMRIAVARLKRNAAKNAFQAAAVFAAMLVISFMAIFIAEVYEFTLEYPSYGLPSAEPVQDTVFSYGSFVRSFFSMGALVMAAVGLISLISLYVWSQMQKEADSRFYATLTSIGATSHQRRTVALIELAALYFIPITLGVLLACFPAGSVAENFTHIFVPDYSVGAYPIGVSLILILLGAASVLVSTVASRRGPLIERIKGHNSDEAEKPHSYRQSYTFRSMSIEKRIAEKSVDYYKRAYRRISLMLSSTALYPIVAVIFYISLSENRITLDTDPYDGVDTEALAVRVIGDIMIFCTLAFTVLIAVGVIQCVSLIKAQNRLRRETLSLYRSVGMTEKSAEAVLKHEYRKVVFNSLSYLLVLALAVAALFAILG